MNPTAAMSANPEVAEPLPNMDSTPPIPRSRNGDWTWELVREYPRQGEWTEEAYLSRDFEGLVEFVDGVLEFIDPLYTPEEGGPPSSRRGEWTWELVTEFPRQGRWTEERYLWLPEDIHAELKSGCLEFLPMPTWIHAWIIDYLHDLLKAFVRPQKLGLTASSQVRVRTTPGQIREPGIVFLKPHRVSNPRQPSAGADLVIEVVSEGHSDRERDYQEKRVEYAAAEIPEYWIVDPLEELIIVLTLPAGATEYAVHGEFRADQKATSVLLPEFAVDVTGCFAAGNP